MSNRVGRLFPMLILTIILTGLAYFSTIGRRDIDSLTNSFEVIEVPRDVSILRVSTTWPWKYFQSLTFDKIVEQSDLVAVVEITGPIESYSDGENYPFTLHTGRIIHTLKGRTPDNIIRVLQYGGYDTRAGGFILNEGLPLIRKGDYWLFFLQKMDWEPNFKMALPDNTFHPQPLTSLKYEKGYVKTPTETAPLLPEQLKISGLTLQEFKSRYIKP